jgi:hypothetical protein
MAQTFFVGDENKRLEQLKTNSQTDICLVFGSTIVLPINIDQSCKQPRLPQYASTICCS